MNTIVKYLQEEQDEEGKRGLKHDIVSPTIPGNLTVHTRLFETFARLSLKSMKTIEYSSIS